MKDLPQNEVMVAVFHRPHCDRCATTLETILGEEPILFTSECENESESESEYSDYSESEYSDYSESESESEYSDYSHCERPDPIPSSLLSLLYLLVILQIIQTLSR